LGHKTYQHALTRSAKTNNIVFPKDFAPNGTHSSVVLFLLKTTASSPQNPSGKKEEKRELPNRTIAESARNKYVCNIFVQRGRICLDTKTYYLHGKFFGGLSPFST
jgi:hypothetical protein